MQDDREYTKHGETGLSRGTRHSKDDVKLEPSLSIPAVRNAQDNTLLPHWRNPLTSPTADMYNDKTQLVPSEPFDSPQRYQHPAYGPGSRKLSLLIYGIRRHCVSLKRSDNDLP